MKNKYDNEPVEFCAHCKSLFILEHEDKVICGKCSTENYTNIASNIFEYLSRFE